MDDLRSRYRTTRPDYGGPVRRPARHAYSSDSQPMFVPAPRPQPVPTRPVPRPQPQPPVQQPPAQHHRSAEHHHAQPVHPAPAAAHRQVRKKSRRGLKILIVLIILAGLGAGGFFGYQKFYAPNPFPQEVRQSKLDLLYPAKLPAGFVVYKNDIDLSNGILIYDAKNTGGDRLVFTVQSTPSNFDFNTFYKAQLTGSRQVQTVYGTAVIGKNSGRSLGSLVDGDTWLLLSTNSKNVSLDDMSLVIKNLKKYPNQ